MQTSSSDFYQTQWEEYYNQLAEAESVESPTTYNKNSDFLSLVHKNALKDKQDFLGLGGMDVSISYTLKPRYSEQVCQTLFVLYIE